MNTSSRLVGESVFLSFFLVSYNVIARVTFFCLCHTLKQVTWRGVYTKESGILGVTLGWWTLCRDKPLFSYGLLKLPEFGHTFMRHKGSNVATHSSSALISCFFFFLHYLLLLYKSDQKYVWTEFVIIHEHPWIQARICVCTTSLMTGRSET